MVKAAWEWSEMETNSDGIDVVGGSAVRKFECGCCFDDLLVACCWECIDDDDDDGC